MTLLTACLSREGSFGGLLRHFGYGDIEVVPTSLSNLVSEVGSSKGCCRVLVDSSGYLLLK